MHGPASCACVSSYIHRAPCSVMCETWRGSRVLRPCVRQMPGFRVYSTFIYVYIYMFTRQMPIFCVNSLFI